MRKAFSAAPDDLRQTGVSKVRISVLDHAHY